MGSFPPPLNILLGPASGRWGCGPPWTLVLVLVPSLIIPVRLPPILGQDTWEVSSRGMGLVVGIGQTKLEHYHVMQAITCSISQQSILVALIVSLQKQRSLISDFMIDPNGTCADHLPKWVLLCHSAFSMGCISV